MPLTWYPLEAKDLPVYTKYYSMIDTNVTDLTFHCRFAWDNVFRVEWTILEECLIQISGGGDYTSPFMLMPLGRLTKEKLETIVRAVRPIFDERKWAFRICGIDESQKELFAQLDFPKKLHYSEASSDYLYDAEALRTLPGKLYSKKRNHYSRFLRTYPDHQYVSLSPDIFEECLSLAEFWVKEKNAEIGNASESDYYMIRQIFDHWDQLKAKGGAIRIDGKVVAFSIGSLGREDIGFIHFEKADTSYDGLYAAINKLVLENEFPSIRFINREEDMGIPGLRKAKESYFPIQKVNKWKCELP